MSQEPKKRQPAKGTLEECIDNGECRPKHRSSKPTSDWCKGREGLVHVWEYRPVPWKGRTATYYHASGQSWPAHEPQVVTYEQRCVECGKLNWQGRAKRRCADCWVPVHRAGWTNHSYVVHGVNCTFHDKPLYDGRRFVSLEDLRREWQEAYEQGESTWWCQQAYENAKRVIDDLLA